jgi:hypothetical protein
MHAQLVPKQTTFEALKTLYRITVNADGPSGKCSTGHLVARALSVLRTTLPDMFLAVIGALVGARVGRKMGESLGAAVEREIARQVEAEVKRQQQGKP